MDNHQNHTMKIHHQQRHLPHHDGQVGHGHHPHLMKLDLHKQKEAGPEHSEKHDHGEQHGKMIEDFRRRFWISAAITIPIIFISPMIHHFLGIGDSFRFTGDMLVLFALSSAVYFYGGWPFLKGFFSEMKKMKPGMMTLIGLAISVAYFYSSAMVFGVKGDDFFWELATLIDIMLLGHLIEMKSVMSTSKALKELTKLMPDKAHKINEDGTVSDISISDLNYNDKLLIKPGEKIPADGKIFEGKTSINESMITGESQPVYKKDGDNVIGGSINGEGSIKIIVEKTGDETFLSQVVKLVKEAQASKSRTQNLANKAAFWITVAAILGGAATMFAWLVFAGESFNFALTRTVTVMVITCPHALGLAIPLVVAVSTTLSAKNGLLIRNRTAFEQARKIQAIIFDKTGTLTKGEFGVTDVIILDNKFGEEEVLSYAAAVESESEHPIAQGIVSYTQNEFRKKQSDEKKYRVEEFNSIPGRGAEGKVNKMDVKVVSPGYLEENFSSSKNSGKDEEIKKLSEQGKTVVFILIDNKLAGAIALADIIREESKQAIKELKEMGIKTMMLTGDNKRVAKWAADELGLDEYFAEVLPGEKSEKIKEVQNRGLTVAMTGDGVNDAPALAQADVGIAVGAGTDVAIETADVILVRNNPKDVVNMIKFARATYLKMIQNLLWATGYNVVTIPLAAGVFYYSGIVLSPALGAVLMSLSTVIVAVNAKLLKV
jgi:Cu2+-exporting ATPase